MRLLQPSNSSIHKVVPTTVSAATDTTTALHQFARSLVDRPTLDELLAQALRTAAQLTASPHATVLLLDASEHICYRVALDSGNLAPLALVAGPMMQRGLAGWVVRERRTALVRDTMHDARWLPGPGLGDLRSAIVMPLCYGEQVLGVLTLGHEIAHHYQPDHIALVETIGAQITLALALLGQRGRLAVPPPQTAAHIATEGHPQPEMAAAAVLAAELRGFAPVADTPQEMLALAKSKGAFFQAAQGIVAHYGSTHTVIYGDMLLTVFGAANEAIQAAQAAAALKAAAAGLRMGEQHQFQHVSFAIGIGYGPLITLTLPGATPLVYLSGLAVTSARRLCALAHNEILLAQPVAAALVPHTQHVLRPLPPFHVLPGVSQPIFQLNTDQ